MEGTFDSHIDEQRIHFLFPLEMIAAYENLETLLEIWKNKLLVVIAYHIFQRILEQLWLKTWPVYASQLESGSRENVYGVQKLQYIKFWTYVLQLTC